MWRCCLVFVVIVGCCAIDVPVVEVSGSPYEIGFAHGRILRERIWATIDFYQRFFNRSTTEVLGEAAVFRGIIKEFNDDYAVEIEAIAEGAMIDPLWIYALNSRTEIYNTILQHECTALFFKSGFLFQNWDWAKQLESLMVFMRITRPDGHIILQLVEPGMIGKIGMNSKGLGVTLNYLYYNTSQMGLPIHVTLRHLLDSDSLLEGKKSLDAFKLNKTSNIIFGSSTGDILNFEFAGHSVYETSGVMDFVHTNHFLKNETMNDEKRDLDSFIRYERAMQLVSQIKGRSLVDAKTILYDQKNEGHQICRPYQMESDHIEYGTVISIVMDLKNLTIHATNGNPLENQYISLSF